MIHLAGEPGIRVTERRGRLRRNAELTGVEILHRDDRVRLHRIVVLVEPEGGEENLIRDVRIERLRDLRDLADVAIDELRDALGIVDRAGAGATPDIQGALREAEILLDVDEQQVNVLAVAARLAHAVALAEVVSLVEDLEKIGAVAPHLGVLRVEEARQGDDRRSGHRLAGKSCTHENSPFAVVKWGTLLYA